MPKFHKPFKGSCAYEVQLGRHVFQWVYSDNFNWRKYATFYRFNYFTTK